MKPGLVAGVGSPAVGDRIGWRVVERLATEEVDRPGRVRLQALDRPGPALVAALQGAAFAVIVDAVRSGGPPGGLHRFGPQDRLPQGRPASSHDFGVAEALALGERLGDLPPWVLIGAEADTEADLEEAVVARVARAVRREIDAFLA